MTNPKSLKSIPTRLRFAAQDAIMTGIVGQALQAETDKKPELADAIRQIGGSLAKTWKTELPELPAPIKQAESPPHPHTVPLKPALAR